jgi:lipopolysaccharide export system permease protein
MRLSLTLSLYLARHYFASVMFVFGILAALIFIFDVIEHLRRASGRDDAGFLIVLTMALFNLPVLAQKMLPIAALFGAMLSFSRLTRSNELIVARAAGISVWQFLMPPLLIAVLLGGGLMAVYNPLAAAMFSRYESLEARHLEGQSSLLAVSSTGLWLRQADPAGQSVVHAQQISAAGTELRDVIIFLYHGNDKFVGRLDAKTASLEEGRWELKDVLHTRTDTTAVRHETYNLPTTLTLQQIQESFASPETLSFWALPGFIETLEEAGFSGVRHRLHWHSLLATPLMLCAMVLLAATVALRLNRRGYTGVLIAVGFGAAFVLYIFSDIVFALGTAGSLPVSLAAWTPAGICTLLGVALLLHLEDG